MSKQPVYEDVNPLGNDRHTHLRAIPYCLEQLDPSIRVNCALFKPPLTILAHYILA